MASELDETMLKTSIHLLNSNQNVIMQTILPGDVHTEEQNASFPEGCVKVLFSQMEYLPWDNPDNIVSADVEETSRRFKDMSLAVMFLIGGPSNVINMAVFYTQGLRERVNVCLFALSLADELYLLTAMFSYGEQLHLQFTTKEQFGPMLTFITNSHLTVFQGFCYVSPVLSAIIASERCHCVLSPLSYQTSMRTRTMAVLIGAVYVVVLSLYFVVSFRYRLGCLHDPESGAVLTAPVMGSFYRAHRQSVDFLHIFVFGLGLPGVEIAVVTTTTVVTIVKLRQSLAWRSGASSSLSAREVGLTRMLVGNSILFITCVVPGALTRLIWLVFPEMNSGGRNQNFFLASLWITQVFIFVNSTFNIIVYYAMGSRYRNTFWKLLGRKCKTDKDFKNIV